MSRKVRVVILCEDRQHEVFARRFLKNKKTGFEPRDIYVDKSPTGRGSAEQYVRERFPTELKAIRAKRREEVYLIVMLDGDDQGAARRRHSLETACIENGIDPAGAADKLLLCVPTWNIETWLAYLDGEAVEETKPDYPRLKKPSDCTPHVDNLAKMCRVKTLRSPYPPSLEDTCIQYRRLFG